MSPYTFIRNLAYIFISFKISHIVFLTLKCHSLRKINTENRYAAWLGLTTLATYYDFINIFSTDKDNLLSWVYKYKQFLNYFRTINELKATNGEKTALKRSGKALAPWSRMFKSTHGVINFVSTNELCMYVF